MFLLFLSLCVCLFAFLFSHFQGGIMFPSVTISILKSARTEVSQSRHLFFFLFSILSFRILFPLVTYPPILYRTCVPLLIDASLPISIIFTIAFKSLNYGGRVREIRPNTIQSKFPLACLFPRTTSRVLSLESSCN